MKTFRYIFPRIYNARFEPSVLEIHLMLANHILNSVSRYMKQQNTDSVVTEKRITTTSSFDTLR